MMALVALSKKGERPELACLFTKLRVHHFIMQYEVLNGCWNQVLRLPNLRNYEPNTLLIFKINYSVSSTWLLS